MTGEVVKTFSEEDASLTREIGVLDCHNDFALGMLKHRRSGDFDSLRTYWLPRFRAGGVKIVVAPVLVPDMYLPEGALRLAFQIIDGLFREIEDNADQIAFAESVADIRRINAEGKIAVLLSFEGTEPMGIDLSGFRLFHRLGLRMLGLTWMRRTAFADGSWENISQGGLTRLGRQAIAEMNRLGIVVDISHASDQSVRDILDVAVAPVIASHSNARAVCDHPRNLTDETIRGVAASGGVVGVVAVSRFTTGGPPTVASLVDHIDYIAELVGIEHVGVGADFARYLYEIDALPVVVELAMEGAKARHHPFEELHTPEQLPAITAELRRRGYGREDIARILNGNFLRVLENVIG